jgi:hypothetical protein
LLSLSSCKTCGCQGKEKRVSTVLEVEVGGLGEVLLVLFEGRETLVQKKLKRHDN